jgi:hypothetical protein
MAFFGPTTASFCKNCDNNIGFWEKRQFFRRKLAKNAENCDHNIDPRVTRWVCEKIYQIMAKNIFFEKSIQRAFTKKNLSKIWSTPVI